MNKKIAILRGINVGGKKKILMADLRILCENLGWTNVKTFIQSGNLIFNATEENAELGKRLENAITEKYGFDVPVMLRNSEEVQTLIDKNPFYDKQAELGRLHITFLNEKPIAENVKQLETCNYQPDKFVMGDKEVFIFCKGKYHESKLTNNFIEKKLKVTATTRNWKSLLKLNDLSRE